MVSIVCKAYTDHTRPEFDSPLLQKGWFDSNSVAEGLERRDTGSTPVATAVMKKTMHG